MFGGLAFLLHGNMCVGVVNERLMVRVGAEAYASALAAEGTSEMDFTGKPLKGFVYVDSPRIDSDRVLGEWVRRGTDFAVSLPPK
jgi:TfoX/Sxy family transcriptional regulator of competence genes